MDFLWDLLKAAAHKPVDLAQSFVGAARDLVAVMAAPERVLQGLGLVVDYPDWREWRILEHGWLALNLLFWAFHPRMESRRYVPAYFALAFLSVSGAMGFVGYLSKGAVRLPGFELLAAVLMAACLVDVYRMRSVYHLPIGAGGGGTPPLRESAWRWVGLVPLAAGFWYPVAPFGKKAALLVSPYCVWPQPTLMAFCGCLLLAGPGVSPALTIPAGLIGLYFGLLGWLKLGIGWDAVLVAASAGVLISAVKRISSSRAGTSPALTR